MKKLLLSALVITSFLSGHAQIECSFPKSFKGQKIVVSHALTQKMADAKVDRESGYINDTIKIKKTKFSVPVDNRGGAFYRFDLTPDDFINLYTSPGEKISLEIKNVSPLEYEIQGSVLMKDIETLNARLLGIQKEYDGIIQRIRKGEPADENKLDSLAAEFEKSNLNFAENNPDSPAVAYAVSNLSGDNFLKAYDNMTAAARSSALYPFVVASYDSKKKAYEAEQATKAMIQGHVEAPDFTLPDLKGENVTLSSLRGKYVILDFWGSWCIWCIKGFPKLKENYEKYADNLLVVGVDCGDTDQAWRDAVNKYKLPWINLFNGDKQKDAGILAKYNVQGFPTKVLIDPEGKIVTVAVGEDPEFYTVLEKVME